MTWANTEFRNLDLGDKRLKNRAIKLIENLAKSPKSSIPESCQGWAETQATYRFYANENVTWDKVLQGHADNVEERIRLSDSAVILCLQDTTELDFNGKQTEDLGRLSYDAQRGMYLHPTLCVTPDRIPLGVTDAWMWARGKSKENDQQQDTIKESCRWIEGYERVAEMAERCPEQKLVYVADREGDILNLMIRSMELNYPADWLVRAKHNRKVASDEKLWDLVDKQPITSRINFIKPRKKGEKSRKVQQVSMANRIEPFSAINIEPLFQRKITYSALISVDSFPLPT
ncbi:MAG: IS4 family transposase [Methylobacter sp.]|nr:IS4 family transposase [Methylobacter sp.]